MPLNQKQRDVLIQGVNQAKYLGKVVEYTLAGEFNFPDDFPGILPEVRTRIQEEIDRRRNQPDTREQTEWANVDKNSIRDLKRYIDNWKGTRPFGNHVDEALELANKMEWDEVDKFDYEELRRYYTSHPGSPFLDEADDLIWALVGIELRKLRKFVRECDWSKYKKDAERMIEELEAWAKVDKTQWKAVLEYKKNHPDSLIIDEVERVLADLVDKEVEKIRQNPSAYSYKDFKELVDSGLVDFEDMEAEGFISKDAYARIETIPRFRQTNKIPVPVGKDTSGRGDDVTDIFLFGIPATGKTCVLMGLLGSRLFHFNSVVSDGDYGDVLQDYFENGILPLRTVGGQVAVCSGYIRDNSGIEHPVNIIDMAGEDFALKIAKNPDKKVAFSDMGHGATALLSTTHRKAFLLVVDPTNDRITFDVKITHKDEDGDEYNTIEYITVSQRQTLNRMVNLFNVDKNRKVMNTVDSINVLLTKADTLGDIHDRHDKAIEKIDVYRTIISDLKELCGRDNLDIQSPRLFPFSLGNFYIGGIFEPDTTDADNLLKMFAGDTKGVGKDSMWNRLIKILNRELGK